MRILARVLSDRRGSVAVEFAIISVVFVSLLVAIVDFGRTLYVKNQLSFLADQAARTVLINPTIANGTLEASLRADFNGGAPESLTVSINTQVVGASTFKVMTLSYPMTLFIPTLTSKALQLDVTRRVPIT